MMSEHSLSGGMGFASSVAEHSAAEHSAVTDQMQQHQCQQILIQNSECHYEPSMEMMMSNFDQMLYNQQCDSGNNRLQSRETGGNCHCDSESIADAMAVPESLVQQEDCDALPELMEEDYSFLEELLCNDAQEPIGDGESIDETDGMDHSSTVAEKQFEAFVVVLDQTVQNSSLALFLPSGQVQHGIALLIFHIEDFFPLHPSNPIHQNCNCFKLVVLNSKVQGSIMLNGHIFYTFWTS